ncbi:MAG: Holliday junction resolvase RuvX [Saprospiraceae bacterium]
MARILGLDYGTKKCGLATTDPLQIIVTAIDTISTVDILPYLKEYMLNEEVEKIVIGKPIHIDGNPTYLQEHIDLFVKKLISIAPNIKVDYIDERLTSIQAKKIIFKSGIKKSKRRDKTLVDKISAVLILQKYLNHI